MIDLPSVAEPVVNLGIPSAPLWINTTESTELMCSVAPSNDTAVDLQEMTIYNITWQDMDRKLLHNNSRIMIKFPSNSSSVLSLLPLSVADYNLSCNVIATALHTGDYIIPSSPVTVNGSLRINSKQLFCFDCRTAWSVMIVLVDQEMMCRFFVSVCLCHTLWL